ncbi:MAG TPA: hypothetical protein ENG33_04770, partial [Chloroflexi bacterium]|nr:hypothetical protein [Chloroflexota bacterium]
ALAPYPRTEEAASISWPFEGVGAEVAVREPRAEYVAGRVDVLGQVDYTYIIARSPDGLVIVDQHAAHEQVLFERILSGQERYPINPPSYVELTAGEAEFLEPHVPLLNELGLELEPFGGTAFLVRSVPYQKLPLPLGELLEKLAAELKEAARLPEEALREKLAMRLACLGAVKRGDILAPEQMQALVDELMSAWSPSTCPHGRPAFIVLSHSEIEKRFLRR